jgi:uncharacterized membrane protein (Fun14 family)
MSIKSKGFVGAVGLTTIAGFSGGAKAAAKASFSLAVLRSARYLLYAVALVSKSVLRVSYDALVALASVVPNMAWSAGNHLWT